MRGIDKSHHALTAWVRVMVRLRATIVERALHPSQVVVLVPYAQLIQQARTAWVATGDSVTGAPGTAGAVATASFLPRFESTMNWARTAAGFAPTGDDLRLNAAFDILTARDLLHRAGLGAHAAVLAPQLMEAAWSLAAVAGAQMPQQRSEWGAGLALTALPQSAEPALAHELAVGRIALAWASSSGFASDGLFEADPSLLVVIDGFQAEPLVDALAQREPRRCLRIALSAPEDEAEDKTPLHTDRAEHAERLGSGAQAHHAAEDFEDEAERAAACVLQHLAAGRSPVGLVALDRQLTRRVRALLGERGVVIRDETGWKLSTTRAAATLMGSLRACRWDASSDEVLDWLKNAPCFVDGSPPLVEKLTPDPGLHPLARVESGIDAAMAAVNVPIALVQLERDLRRLGQRDWPTEPLRLSGLSPSSTPLIHLINSWRSEMHKSRALSQWLLDLAELLARSGQWRMLMADAAGRAVATALGLPTEPQALGDAISTSAPSRTSTVWQDFAPANTRLTASEFTAWVSQTLEAASYSPAHPHHEQVVILPLAQLLGRPLAAVVLAGCDEQRLPVSPEVPGLWTVAQRVALGLPAREDVARALAKSWRYALRFDYLDILWRTSEGGERLLPSGFVQALRQHPGTRKLAPDPRRPRELVPHPSSMPRPVGQALALQRVSASAYDDLRKCPYRFFALRQLKLAEAEELDVELGKRDFGNWLHRTLFHFHEAFKTSHRLSVEVERDAREALINHAAEQATADLGLSEAEFLPFAAAWPKVRTGYLDWLADHLSRGNVFVEGEAWKDIRLGTISLVGKLDRVDREADGTCLVIDYKTENRTASSERIKSGNEDTQLAFYAALIDVDNIAAAYVNVGEKEPTKTYAQPAIVQMRAQLAEGILNDMQRIAQGEALPALGDGFACEFCAARGLCRKDFWKS